MRHIPAPIGGATAALAALASLLFCAAPASAQTALAELRVEGPGETLDPGTWYVTGTERVKRGRGNECDPRPGTRRFPGPTALGLAATAQRTNRALRPVRFRATDFGMQLCQVGAFSSFGAYPGASGGWLYFVNGTSGFGSPAGAELKNGNKVVLTYGMFPSDPPSGTDESLNSGTLLGLRGVPARDVDGVFRARVVEFDFAGNATPVDDAKIEGAQEWEPLGAGRYRVVVAPGRTTLRAVEGAADASFPRVPSNQLTTCVRAKLANCPAAHGRTIVGSKGRDKIAGSKGWDVIRAGGGRDRIDLRRGGRDRVNCGGGRDVVLLKRGDNDDILRNCERIRRR